MTTERDHIPSGDDGELPERLARHLDIWLGQWRPPGGGELIVVGSDKRTTPGWDGVVRPFLGIETLSGAVLSVPPDRVAAVEALGDDLDEVGRHLAEALELRGERRFGRGIFRWSTSPVPPGTDRLGEWLPTSDPRVLPWLRPFNGDVLVGFGPPDADGERPIAAGVGRKIHDAFGHELAVVTEEGHRGEGWARRLVSQAAQRVIDDGAIPTYLHAEDNHASAATADACGFPDRGWRILGLFGG